MTQANFNCSIDDLLCVWLDEVIPKLEELEYFRWFGEKDVSIPEALRPQLFYVIQRFLQKQAQVTGNNRKILKFPSSAVSRVNRAISHLQQGACSEQHTEANVVFLPTSLVHLAQQIPVAKELSSLGKSYTFVFPSSSFAKNIGLGDLNRTEHSRYLRAQMLSARLRARVLWLRLGRESLVRLPPFNLNDSTFDLSHTVLSTIANSVSAVFEGYALARYILNTLNPKLIVMGNDLSAFGRTVSASAKKNGIRCVEILSHAAGSPIDSYRQSDKIIVFGNHAKRALSFWGVENRKIKSCGTPYLDALLTQGGLGFLSSNKSSHSKKRQFVFAQLDSDIENRIRIVALKNPDHFFFVLRESESRMDSTDPLMARLENVDVRNKSDLANDKLATCLKYADYVLTSKMKGAIDAFSLGKRVVAIDFDSRFDDREFLKSGIVEVASDEQALSIIMNKSMPAIEAQTQHIKSTMEDLFYRRDGQAPLRAARVIIEECHR